MKHRISNIDTFIKDRRLYVAIYIEDEVNAFIEISYKSFFDLSFNRKSKNPFYKISIGTLELLTCCYLRKCNGLENLFNEYPKTFLRGNNNEWEITYEGDWEELAKANKSKLVLWKEITDVAIIRKELYVRLTTRDNTIYFASFDLIKSLVGVNEDEFHLLKGTYISPDLYKKGESPQFNIENYIKTLKIRFEGTLEGNYNWHCEYEKNNKQQYIADYKSSYQRYNGYNGYDDNTIDNAFNGDPDAIWNVD